MNTVISITNGDILGALQGFLKGLLEQGLVEALLVPMRTPRGHVTPALVSNPELLSVADPLAPVMSGNSATLAGKLSIREPRAKIGVVLRSCELRALIELVKLQQASTDDLVLVAVDCAGTYDVPIFRERTATCGAALWLETFRIAAADPDAADPELRLACRMCEQPVFEGADIAVELFGSDLEKHVHLDLSEELAIRLGLQPAEPNAYSATADLPREQRGAGGSMGGRVAVVERLVAARTAVRDAEFESIRQRLEGNEGIVGVFDACVRCHNCMTVCPICYCKTCVFKSPVFDHEPIKYVNWSNQKGAFRMPADTSLFHLTRLNHMGLSCVGCGMCTQACPADLPVGSVFRAIGQRLQTTFAYQPGRAVDEPLPLVTFKENEWTELGEG